jgi:hypothetical protein
LEGLHEPTVEGLGIKWTYLQTDGTSGVTGKIRDTFLCIYDPLEDPSDIVLFVAYCVPRAVVVTHVAISANFINSL